MSELEGNDEDKLWITDVLPSVTDDEIDDFQMAVSTAAVDGCLGVHRARQQALDELLIRRWERG